MTNLSKVLVGVTAALGTGLLGGFILGYRQTLDCEGKLQRVTAKATSATTALDEQGKRCDQAATIRQHAQLLVEARAELLHALIEVHAKNFGLASQHLEAARRHVESTRDEWPAGKGRQRLNQLAKKMSGLHERTMLLDARVIEQLKGLVSDLQAVVREKTP